MKKIAIIYMGGTFGCIGQPLYPMPAPEFLKKLQSLYPSDHVHFFAAPSIKDSTELYAADWLELCNYIQNLSSKFQDFIIIHGTDTLSYAAAFLLHFFKQQYRIILTGSQQPLLTIDGTELLVKSDAWNNLCFTIEQIKYAKQGVYLTFDQKVHHAHQCYKQHTEDFNAFSSDLNLLEPLYLPKDFKITQAHIEQIKNIRLLNIYLHPTTAASLATEINQISQNPPHILILQGFGSGNLPYNKDLENSLNKLIQNGCWVIISSQVLYGVISQKYATGSWLKNINLVFDPHYSQSDLYARSIILYLQYGGQKDWQQYWI